MSGTPCQRPDCLADECLHHCRDCGEDILFGQHLPTCPMVSDIAPGSYAPVGATCWTCPAELNDEPLIVRQLDSLAGGVAPVYTYVCLSCSFRERPNRRRRP